MLQFPSSPRRRGPIRRALSMWHGLRSLSATVIMGPRFRGDDSGKVVRFASLALLLVLTAASRAVQAADFYQGKQITIVVGFSTGGTYDVTARLWSRYLGKHLAGNPSVIVRNMPGSGSLVATNHLA